ncbi:unnamed protein product [Sympodiomycopsis kandeliae]
MTRTSQAQGSLPLRPLSRLLTILSFLLLIQFSESKPVERTTINRDPGLYPGGRNQDKKGWRMLPDVPGAIVDASTIKVGQDGMATLTSYVTAEFDPKKIKRAVIQVHGMNRDSWNQWMYADMALQRAVSGGQVEKDQVVIMAPQFFTSNDWGAFDATMGGEPMSGQMIWEDEKWAEGFPPMNPPESTVGAFDALDAAIDYFLDRERFPELVTVVLGGFSLGGQLVQRYSLLRPLRPDQDSRINYWICSPNSFLYLNSTRPLSVRDCPNWNAYKYGLEGILPTSYLNITGQSKSDITEVNLAQRMTARKASYAVGNDDKSAGSGECEARAQGRTHLSKMMYWSQNVLSHVYADHPKSYRVDYVQDTAHQDYRMIQSDSAVQSLFLEDYQVRGKDAKKPKSNGLKSLERQTSKDADGDGNEDDQDSSAATNSFKSLSLALTLAASLALVLLT